MERIAIIGYLGKKRELIPRYFAGGLNPHKEAMAWAKKELLQNWMVLYSALSDVAHSKIAGAAGHVNNRTAIGSAFRQIPNSGTMKEADATEEFFALTVYALLALDSLALHLIQDNSTKPFPNDPEMVHHVDPIDAKRFMDFLTGLVKRYKKQSP